MLHLVTLIYLKDIKQTFRNTDSRWLHNCIQSLRKAHKYRFYPVISQKCQYFINHFMYMNIQSRKLIKTHPDFLIDNAQMLIYILHINNDTIVIAT